MKTISIEDLVRWGACTRYILADKPTELTLSLFDGRETLTTADVAHMDISIRDKLWVLAHAEIDKVVEFAKIIAEKALNYAWLHTGIEPDDLSWKGIEFITPGREPCNVSTTRADAYMVYSTCADIMRNSAYAVYLACTAYVHSCFNAMDTATYVTDMLLYIENTFYTVSEEYTYQIRVIIENELKAIFHG